MNVRRVGCNTASCFLGPLHFIGCLGADCEQGVMTQHTRLGLAAPAPQTRVKRRQMALPLPHPLTPPTNLVLQPTPRSPPRGANATVERWRHNGSGGSGEGWEEAVPRGRRPGHWRTVGGSWGRRWRERRERASWLGSCGVSGDGEGRRPGGGVH